MAAAVAMLVLGLFVPLAEAVDYAFTEGRNTQGVVVVTQGAIVAERYDDAAQTRRRPAGRWPRASPAR